MIKEKLERITEEYCQKHDVQALSVCINKDEKTVFEMSLGKTAKEGRKVKKDSCI